MARRGNDRPLRPRASERAPRDPDAVLNRPFAELGRKLRDKPPPTPPPRVIAPPKPPEEPNLFARAMEGVVPLRSGNGARIGLPAPAAAGRPPISDEAEALAELSDLVKGASRFDVSDTREYIEGTIVGLDPRVVRRLRRGDFSWQAYVDLHGLTAEPARATVESFLRASVIAGHRCVLIVHGRGHNSKDHTPVLKERLQSWLARGSLARIVLAFTSARPCDGGAGALYVLLRRDRRRRPMRVTEGAKV
jgi:DNA-nicking Smr family endonuclease